MRNFFFTIVMAFVMIISNVMAAEAAPRNCTCTSPMGTIERNCPKHRGCVGIQQHQHESRSLKRNIPVLCEVNDFYLLIDPNGPTCREVKRELKRQARLQKLHERELANAYKRAAREERLARRNNPLYWILDTAEREARREVRREVREEKNHLKRKIRREIRDIF